MVSSTSRTALHHYVELDEAYYIAYEAYQPDVATLRQVYVCLPTAHVIVSARRTCPDCLRHIPAMARIAEHLPGWTWEIFESEAQPERRLALGIVRVPTFILYAGSEGRELGRIVENPISGSLERDLLAIVCSHSAVRNSEEAPIEGA